MKKIFMKFIFIISFANLILLAKCVTLFTKPDRQKCKATLKKGIDGNIALGTRIFDAFDLKADQASIIIIDSIEGKEKFTLCKGISCHGNFVSSFTAVTTSLYNGFLISGGYDSTVKIWDLRSKTLIRTIQDPEGSGLSVARLLNGDIASGPTVTFNYVIMVKIWDSNTGTLKFTLKGHDGSIRVLAALKNGNLASGSSDKMIKIWDSKTGDLKFTLSGHADQIISLVTLKNGDLASGSMDTSIKIWDVETGTLKLTLNGHNNTVTSLVVLKNGDLASASTDSIIIWNTYGASAKKIIRNNENSQIKLAVMENGDLVSAHQFYPTKGSDVVKIWKVAKSDNCQSC